MKKFDLPPWIEGLTRRVLLDYINGGKPKKIYKKYGIDANYITFARHQHAIPSQLELRRRGLLPPTPFGEGSTLHSRIRREERFDKAVAEYMADGPDKGIVRLAKKHKISAASLSEALKAKGVEIKRGQPRKPREPSERNKAIVHAVVHESMTLEEVGRIQNPPISRERVRQICAAAGYKLGFRPEIREKVSNRRAASRYRHPQEDEIIAVLRADRNFPKDVCARYGVTLNYIMFLRKHFKIPKSNRMNWRTDEDLERERQAIDAYYNKLDMTTSEISKKILRANNPAAVVQLVKRRGLERTRGKIRFGAGYQPNVKPRKRYSEATRLAALRDYQDANIPLPDIYEKYGISQLLLGQWRKRYNIAPVHRTQVRTRNGPKRDYQPALSTEDIKRLDDALYTGVAARKSRTQLARELNLSFTRISKRANALGLVFDPKWGARNGMPAPSKATVEEIRALDLAIRTGHAMGKSLTLISKENGYSFGRVQRRAKRLGIAFGRAPTAIAVGGRFGKGHKTRIARNKAIVADYLADVPIREIMQKHKIVNSQLYKILDHHDIDRKRPKDTGKRKATAAEQLVLDDYAAGVPRADIYRRHAWLESNDVKLDNLCNFFGVKRPEGYIGQRISEKQRNMLSALYKPGRTTIQELADRVGVSYSTARNHLVEKGLFKPSIRGHRNRK